MFWGLILKANKKYTQILEKPFHLSQAALDQSSSDNEPVQVMYSHEDSSYLLCTLQKGVAAQCALDLNFAEGDKLCFLTKGNGIVHLTGFLIPEEEDLDFGNMGSEEEEDEESEVETPDLREKLNSKNNKVKETNKKEDKKKAKVQEEVEEDDDESDEEMDLSAMNDDDDSEDDDDEEVDDSEAEDDDEDEEEEDDESEEEEVTPPKPKQQKLDPQQEKKKDKKQNGVANGVEKKKTKEQQQQPQEKQQKEGKAGQIQKLQGGLQIQDLKVGNGAEAKVGKKIQVYYEGRLKNNNKVFDATKSGPGFKMTLGRGEVIKGWDIGLTGMKVGGKRRLICPPQLAYGHKGNPPVIPANSTLIFDVELKNVL